MGTSSAAGASRDSRLPANKPTSFPRRRESMDVRAQAPKSLDSRFRGNDGEGGPRRLQVEA
ncbi:hypothetical protein EA658_07660 [Pseudoxanthomonas winnipegensis]|uniref:Uncharacterized protein n=1 Tax=Pseudoxanthomonas winnipegensis TaxID=2480810 RepID=A0ABY1WFU3_9GAMM|nr:hypothetical protein EA659_17885 [Pseudoxanthomonas winnipegensis]TAA20808.1 hypothetical protein EA658_07660 [Pseudoxanthomonas winnipegensis]TAH72278.1 hypothetical protein EA657_08380 [Pseudoxanthomonas winnipegensis]